jgi:hypothetical protein
LVMRINLNKGVGRERKRSSLFGSIIFPDLGFPGKTELRVKWRVV